MYESILKSIRGMLSPELLDAKDFDTQLIPFINGEFSKLSQLGVGPSGGFHITGETETWSDFSDDERIQGMSKYYIYLRVSVVFDSQTKTSSILSYYKEQADETAWRLCSMSEVG